MNMSFIGAGKVGTALGIYLKNNGFKIDGYYSKSFESAQKAAELTNSRAYKSIDEVASSNMIWITTNDDAIEEVGSQLAKLDGIGNEHIVAHMSGVHSSTALKELKIKGCSVYSIHPLQAFADILTAVEALTNTVFTIEGSKERLAEVIDILNQTKNQYFIIDESGKTLYHAGACVLSNYLVTLIDSALHLFEEAGMNRQEIFSASMPLVLSTLDNIQKKDTKAALTGPIQRNDLNTLNKHLIAIEKQCGEELDFYKYMAQKTIEMMIDHKSKEQIEALNNVFN